jgi:hypothetical protein
MRIEEFRRRVVVRRGDEATRGGAVRRRREGDENKRWRSEVGGREEVGDEHEVGGGRRSRCLRKRDASLGNPTSL